MFHLTYWHDVERRHNNQIIEPTPIKRCYVNCRGDAIGFLSCHETWRQFWIGHAEKCRRHLLQRRWQYSETVTCRQRIEPSLTAESVIRFNSKKHGFGVVNV